MTYEIAMAAGRDAAHRNAKANGRAVWNAEDWDLAAEVTNRLLALAAETAEAQ